MTNPFKRIGLIAKLENPRVAETLIQLTAELAQRGVDVTLDESAASYFTAPDLTVNSRLELSQNCDLAIVVGGDGTMLNAARSLAEADIPVLGINLGRLGFLTDISPDEIHERLSEILAGQYDEERRSLLHAEIIRDEKVVNEGNALNDVVIHKWDIARMIELDTTINGRFIYALRADGLIISTPTGSTAYALSGGGPILEPNLPAFVLVPICPHTLSNRPVVVDEHSSIVIKVRGNGTEKAQITCDGQINFPLLPGDQIHIQRMTHQFRLLHPAGHDHFNTMRKKLSWAG